MGHLLKLELENFKSYPALQTIGPFDRFTAIIGPNGSGKSNLMDAISFVLGINSVSLRSSNLGELVYRPPVLATLGAEEKENAGSFTGGGRSARKGPSRATVSAYYQPSPEAPTVVLSRSVNTSGVSEYSIDSRPIPFQRYNAYLESQNILVKARNFLVFQGDVEALAAKSSKELAKMVEQISTSDELRGDYDRAKEEDLKCVDAVALAFDQRKAIASELKSIKAQKEDVQKYQELHQQHDNLVVEHLLWKLFHLEESANELHASIEEAKAKIDESNINAGECEESHQATKRQLAKTQKDALIHEKKLKKFRQDYDAEAPDAIELNEKSRLLGLKQHDLEATINKTGEEVTQCEAEQTKIGEDLAMLKAAQEHFEKSAEEQSKRAQLTPESLKQYQDIRAQVNLITAREQLEKEQLQRSNAPALSVRKLHEEKCHEYSLRLAQLGKEGGELKTRRETLANDLASNESSIGGIQREEAACQKKLVSLQRTHAQVTDQLRQVNDRLLNARVEIEHSERELKLRSTVDSMKRIFPGVHGRLIDLCSPVNKKYEQALGILLGRNMDAIVVDQHRVAIDCIKFLKDQRLMSATFIPLDSIKVQGGGGRNTNANDEGDESDEDVMPAQHQGQLPNGCRRAIEVIKYEDLYERAIVYACGNTVICDTLANARYLCYDLGHKVKAITLDGQIIHRNGMMTGGSLASSTDSAFKTSRGNRWEEKELSDLKTEKERLHAQLTALIKEIKQVDSLPMDKQTLLAELVADRKRKSDQIATIEHRLAVIGKSIQDLNGALAKEGRALAESIAFLAQYEARLSALDAVIQSHEDELFAPFCAKQGISNIRGYEQDRISLLGRLNAKRLEFVTLGSNLTNRLEFLDSQKTTLKERLSSLQDQLLECTSSMRDISKQLAQIDKRREKSAQALSAIEREQQALRESVEEESKSVAILKRASLKARHEVDRLTSSIGVSEVELERVQDLKVSLIRKCKLDDLELPLVRGSLARVSLGHTGLPLDAESEDALDPLRQLKVDYSRLPRETKKRSDEVFEHNRYVKPLKVIDEQIENLAPNVRALEK